MRRHFAVGFAPAMVRLFKILCALAGGAVLVSCASLRKKGPEPVKGTENAPGGPTYLIGLVELVNPEQRFVLIRTETKIGIPAGHSLIAIDATGAQTTLKVSPETKQNFLTADIADGTPRVGNLVIYRPGQQGVATGPQAAPGAAVIPPVQAASAGVPSPSGPGAGDGAAPAGAGVPTPSPIPVQPLPASSQTPVGNAAPNLPAVPGAGAAVPPAADGSALPPIVR